MRRGDLITLLHADVFVEPLASDAGPSLDSEFSV